MADNKLSLIVSFIGQDKLSGALKNIIGLGKTGDRALRGMFGRARELKGQIKDLDAQIAKGTGNLGELVSKQRDLKRELSGVNDQIDRQKRINSIDRRTTAIGNRGAALQSAGIGDIAGGVAMAAPIVLATRQAMTFESAMADVRKVVDFESPRQFDQMGADLLTISTRIPMASEGLAAIAAAAGRAGIARNELLGFTEDAAKMGIAFDIGADEAGAMMAKWRTAFGLNQTGVNALTDQINALTNSYGGNADAVAGIVTRIGALGKVAGVSSSQVGAMAQLLNSVGVEEEVAATGIKNMMLAMTKGTAATKSQKAALADIGLESVSLAKRMQTDAGGAITDLLGRIAKMPKAVQASALSELFGSESIAAIAPMLTNLEALNRNLALVGDSAKYAGSANKEFLSRIATTEGATGLAANALKAVNIELGKQMLPYVTDAAKALVSMAQGLRGFAAEHPGVTKLFAGFMLGGTALAGVRIGLGILKFGFGTVLGPMGKAWALFSKFRAAGSVAAMFPKVTSVLGMAANTFKAFGGAALQAAGSLVRAGMIAMANPMVLAITALVIAVGVAAYLIYSHWDKIKAAFAQGKAWVMGILQSMPDQLRSLGSMMMQGLLAAIDPFGLRNRLLDVARNGIVAFKNFFGIKSPSRLMMQMGGHVAGGLALGLTRNGTQPVRAMGRMAAAVAGAGAIGLAAPSIAAPAFVPPSAPMAGADVLRQPAPTRAAPSITAPAISAPSLSPRSPGGRGGAGGSVSIGPIYIQQQPGEDAKGLADRVIELIERKQRGARARGFEPDF